LARFFDILASVVVCGPLATALVRGQPVTSSISRKVRIGVKHYTGLLEDVLRLVVVRREGTRDRPEPWAVLFDPLCQAGAVGFAHGDCDTQSD
ncbi:MAG: hypothetical protein ACYC6F_19010, partial [Longimicrobiales bacterium]